MASSEWLQGVRFDSPQVTAPHEPRPLCQPCLGPFHHFGACPRVALSLRHKGAGLSPISGLPIKTLQLRGCDLTDLKPLANCLSLEQVYLPPTPPTLSRSASSLPSGAFASPTTAVSHSARPKSSGKPGTPCRRARKLEAAGIDFSFEQSADGYYNVKVHDPKFTDCSIFTGSNVRRLELDRLP